MPLADESSAAAPAGLRVEVAPSAAVELFWALTVDEDGTPVSAATAVLELHRGAPGLAGRLADVWEPPLDRVEFLPGPSVPELVLVADAAGVAAGDDLAGLSGRLERAAAGTWALPALRSESSADAEVLQGRLAALRSDRALRRRWAGVLADAASGLQESWQRSLPVVRRACRSRAAQLPWAEPAATVSGWAGGTFGGKLPELLADASSSGREVLVAPTAWSARGLLLDGPTRLLLGVPAQVGPGESRQRTEVWASQLKALADPTRLAMLDWLASTPRTVTQLADDFGLAQPTVSRHARILREAGLVAESREGGSVELRADGAGVQRLLDALGGALGAGRPDPAARSDAGST